MSIARPCRQCAGRGAGGRHVAAQPCSTGSAWGLGGIALANLVNPHSPVRLRLAAAARIAACSAASSTIAARRRSG